jgi:AcrR family transcriptional regulator
MAEQTKGLTLEQRTELSDQRMFDAAMALILERGTTKTTLKDIGENAGYSRGLANYRFGTKEKLFEALVKHCYRVWLSELALFVGDKSGLDAYRSSIDAFEDFLLEAPREMRVLQILWYESISHQSLLKDKLREQQEKMLSDVTGYLARAQFNREIASDVNVPEFAIRYLAFLFGIVYMWLVNPEGIPVKRIFDSYRKSAGEELSVHS